MKMKKVTILFCTLVGLLLSVGCTPTEKVNPYVKDIVGEWHLSAWNGEKPIDFDAYINFQAEGTFEIYQQFGTVNYVQYLGNYKISDETLTGVYSDAKPFGSSYTMKFSADKNKLTLTSEEQFGEESVYVRASIPTDIKQEAVPAGQARAEVERLL